VRPAVNVDTTSERSDLPQDPGEDAELDLNSDDSLPWLEAEEDERGSGGLDTGQIAGFALLLLAVFALLGGGAYYLSQSGGSNAVEPDGSLIAAPEGPIKQRPADPGGKEFAGTGNVAPVVGEGGTRESRLAIEEPEPEPAGISDEAAPAPAPAAAETIRGVPVQLAAYTTRARAEQGWLELSRRTDVLSGAKHRITTGIVDIGTVYRLQVVAGDRAAANALCEALRADGLDCQVKG
jgi:hypothetical protein